MVTTMPAHTVSTNFNTPRLALGRCAMGTNGSIAGAAEVEVAGVFSSGVMFNSDGSCASFGESLPRKSATMASCVSACGSACGVDCIGAPVVCESLAEVPSQCAPKGVTALWPQH